MENYGVSALKRGNGNGKSKDFPVIFSKKFQDMLVWFDKRGTNIVQ